MEQRAADAAATEILRIIAGYDGRQFDEFQIRAFASGIRKYPQFTREDWHQGIEDWYLNPGSARIRIGDLIGTTREAHRRRAGADGFQLEAGRNYVPRPPHFDQMVADMSVVVREFRAEGLDPTDEDVLREWARRQPHART